MDLRVLAVGRLRPAFREACDDYRRRLSRFARLEEREFREGQGEGAARAAKEAAGMLEAVPSNARLVALTRDGRAWASREFADQVRRWSVESRPVTFAIGGSEGLGEPVLARSAERWSLGPLTLPHELARVIVYEQLYRAFTILEGHPYHRG